MPLAITPLSRSGAAEIGGLDCAKPFTPEVLDQVRQAFLLHPVLVFRDQRLSPAEYAAFAAQFGRIESFGAPRPPAKGTAGPDTSETACLAESGRLAPDVYLYAHPEAAGVQFMTNLARDDMPLIGIVDNAEMWHVDAQHRPDPCKTTILNSILRPAGGGGDTEFSDLTLLWESLDEDIRHLLDGRVGIHHWSKSRNVMFADVLDADARTEGERIADGVPAMRHPLVRRHPDTGRPILFVSPRFTIGIEGLDEESATTLLRTLFQAIEDPRFTYRHHWREGDIVMWDNCRLVHRVHGYDSADVRHLNRITLCGERPV